MLCDQPAVWQVRLECVDMRCYIDFSVCVYITMVMGNAYHCFCRPPGRFLFHVHRAGECWAALFHWGRVMHICVIKVTIIVSDHDLSPGRRQAVIWNNAGILLIEPLGTNFSGSLIEIHTFSFKKMHLKMSSGKWRPSCLGFNVLTIPVLAWNHDDALTCTYFPHFWTLCAWALWRHQMEAFSALLALCAGNSLWRHSNGTNHCWLKKEQQCKSCWFSFLLVLTNFWANNRDTYQLRHMDTHVALL